VSSSSSIVRTPPSNKACHISPIGPISPICGTLYRGSCQKDSHQPNDIKSRTRTTTSTRTIYGATIPPSS
jgi:hypothetical protein